MKCKVLIDDLGGRWKAGEIGECTLTDAASKYHYEVTFSDKALVRLPWMKEDIEVIRSFFFYTDEIEILED